MKEIGLGALYGRLYSAEGFQRLCIRPVFGTGGNWRFDCKIDDIRVVQYQDNELIFRSQLLILRCVFKSDMYSASQNLSITPAFIHPFFTFARYGCCISSSDKNLLLKALKVNKRMQTGASASDS